MWNFCTLVFNFCLAVHYIISLLPVLYRSQNSCESRDQAMISNLHRMQTNGFIWFHFDHTQFKLLSTNLKVPALIIEIKYSIDKQYFTWISTLQWINMFLKKKNVSICLQLFPPPLKTALYPRCKKVLKLKAWDAKLNFVLSNDPFYNSWTMY